MNTQTEIYHNTTGLTGKQLTERRLRAGSQNDKIYRFFRIHSCSVFTTWDIVDNFPEISITLSEIDDEKKEILQNIKQRQDPLKSEKKILLSNIKHKAEEVKEECYKFIDQENNEVGFYNSEGDLIEQRPAYPDERQGIIFQINRTGTDN